MCVRVQSVAYGAELLCAIAAGATTHLSYQQTIDKMSADSANLQAIHNRILSQFPPNSNELVRFTLVK